MQPAQPLARLAQLLHGDAHGKMAETLSHRLQGMQNCGLQKCALRTAGDAEVCTADWSGILPVFTRFDVPMCNSNVRQKGFRKGHEGPNVCDTVSDACETAGMAPGAERESRHLSGYQAVPAAVPPTRSHPAVRGTTPPRSGPPQEVW